MDERITVSLICFMIGLLFSFYMLTRADQFEEVQGMAVKSSCMNIALVDDDVTFDCIAMVRYTYRGKEYVSRLVRWGDYIHEKTPIMIRVDKTNPTVIENWRPSDRLFVYICMFACTVLVVGAVASSGELRVKKNANLWNFIGSIYTSSS